MNAATVLVIVIVVAIVTMTMMKRVENKITEEIDELERGLRFPTEVIGPSVGLRRRYFSGLIPYRHKRPSNRYGHGRHLQLRYAPIFGL